MGRLIRAVPGLRSRFGWKTWYLRLVRDRMIYYLLLLWPGYG